jgi:flagellar biosynthesis protein FlhG
MSEAGSHYETLGLDPRATPQQVERAYHFCLEMYAEESLATYSLLSRDEIRSCRERIQEAYEVLSDPMRRRDYDVRLGNATPGPPVLPFPPLPTLRAEPLVEALAEPFDDGPPAPVVLPDPVTGSDLKKYREARGIRLRDIADASKVGVRYLEYIEGDRHGLLPAPVYLRGFLQEYAKAVGLEPRRTADSYLSRVKPS